MTKPTFDEEAFAKLLEGAQAPRTLDESRMGALAAALTRASSAQRSGPSPAFAAALRDRLVAEAMVVAEAERAARLPLRERAIASVRARTQAWTRSLRVVTAFGLAAAMMIVSGAAFASARHALPGQWNYSLKRIQENAKLAVTRSPLGRGYYELDLARTRLDEVHSLAAARVERNSLYVNTLNDMNGSTLTATDLLVNAARHGAGKLPLERLSRFSLAQKSRLGSLVDQIPAGARPAARASLAILGKLDDRVTSILSGCTCPANPLEIPAVVSGSGSEGQPACTCAAPQPGGSSDSTGATTGGGGDGSSTTPGHPGPTPTTSPAAGGIDLIPGTEADKPANDAVDSVNKVLDGLGLPTLPPAPLPSALPTVPLPKPSLSL